MAVFLFDPLEREEKPSNIPGGICWLNLTPVLWSVFFIIAGPQIWGDTSEYGYGGIQRDTAGSSKVDHDLAGYSGIL